MQDAASHEACEAGMFLMDGLSTLNGSLRPRTGRNDWIRDFSAALARYHVCDIRAPALRFPCVTLALLCVQAYHQPSCECVLTTMWWISSFPSF